MIGLNRWSCVSFIDDGALYTKHNTIRTWILSPTPTSRPMMDVQKMMQPVMYTSPPMTCAHWSSKIHSVSK